MSGNHSARLPLQDRGRFTEVTMHKDQINGAARQAKGAVKDAAGKLTGDVGLQVEGKIDKVAGRVQAAGGKAEDEARKDLNH